MRGPRGRLRPVERSRVPDQRSDDERDGHAQRRGAGGSVRAMHGMLGKSFSQILPCGECSYVQAFFPPQHAKIACRGPRVLWRNARAECHSFAYTICENAVPHRRRGEVCSLSALSALSPPPAALVSSTAAHRVEGRPRPVAVWRLMNPRVLSHLYSISRVTVMWPSGYMQPFFPLQLAAFLRRPISQGSGFAVERS